MASASKGKDPSRGKDKSNDADTGPQSGGEPLTFGDFVLFYSDKREEEADVKTGGGYIYCENPLRPIVHLRTSDIHDPALPNIKGSTFQILPPTKYKMTKKLHKRQKEINKRLEKAKKSSKKVEEDVAMTPDEEAEIEQLKRNAEAEALDNTTEQLRMHNKPVTYGLIVMLRHSMTDNFLAISSEDAAKVDVTNMKLLVKAEGNKHTWFKIMPRYKVRSEGDVVRMGDQVMLESVKTAGQFVHVSRTKAELGEKSGAEEQVLLNYKEIDLSVNRDHFIVRPHSVGTRDESLFLKAGSTISLLHKELDSYLAAEGVFLKDRYIGEDVHLRERKEKKGNKLGGVQTDSSINFWQIETAGHSSRGNVLSWEEPVRFRHMLTRKYLAFKKDGSNWKPTLVESQNDDTYFKIHAVLKEGISILLGSYGRIEHIKSGQWLHGSSTPYQRLQYKAIAARRKQKGGTEVGIEELFWDNATLHSADAFEFRYDDAYALIQAPEIHVNDFNYCAGILPMLDNFLSTYEGKDINKDIPIEYFVSIREALTSLTSFVTEADSLSESHYKLKKSRQKLLRHLRIVDLAISILKMPFKAPDGFKHVEGFNEKGMELDEIRNYPRFRAICKAAYEFLGQYLEGESHKNEIYVARFIPFFQSQLGVSQFGVAKMLLELVSDNEKILDRIDAAQIDSFIFWLRKSRDPNFLEFLDALCICNGRAISASQKTVCDRLLAADSEKGNILFRLNMIDGKVLARGISGGSEWKPIVSFFPDERPEEYDINLNYLERQITLMSVLCHSRNARNSEIIRKMFPYEVVFEIIKDDTLPSPLRTAFIKLLISCYIDAGENIPVLENIKLSFPWKELDKPVLATDKPTKALSGAEMPEFLELRDFILEYIKAHAVMTASELKENALTREVLVLALQLVTFGYYTHDDDVRNLLENLLNLMDGATDQKIKDQKPEELKKWRESNRLKKTKENKSIMNAKYEGLLILDILLNWRMLLTLSVFLSDFKQLVVLKDSGGTLGRTALSQMTHLFQNASTDLNPSLMGIADAVKQNVGSTAAVNYLHYLFKRVDFIDLNRIVPIVLDLSQYHYTKMTFQGMKLVDRLYTQANSLFENGFLCRILVTDLSIKTFDDIQKKLTELRELMEIRQMEKSDEEKMRKILVYFGKICRIEGAITEPHEVNVMLLYQSEVLNDLLAILETKIDMGLAQTGTTEIMSEAFRVLGLMCRNNPVIQHELFEHIDMLIDVQGGPALQADKGLALSEIFLDNQELCVKLRDYQLEKIVSLAAEHHRWEFLQLLNTVVKIGKYDLPIRRNQNYVIKFMMQKRNETILLASNEENEARLRLLLDGSAGKLSVEEMLAYKYHTRLVRLLATCCEGENRFIESMCQNIFDPDEIYEVLLDERIDLNARRPYLRFFLWAWLETDSGSDNHRIQELQYESQIWDLWKILTANFLKFSKKDLEVISDTESGREDVITIFEASLPFMESFFTRYYTPNERVQREQPQSQQVIADLIDSLLVLYDAVRKSSSFATAKRLADIKDVFLVLLDKEVINPAQIERFEEIQHELMQTHHHPKKKDHKKKKNTQTTRRMTTTDDGDDGGKEAKKVYLTLYRQEREINKNLDAFIDRLKTAYEDDPATPRYNDSRLIEGCDDLPLGEEFQSHLSIFINIKQSKHHPAYDGLSKWAYLLILALDVSVRTRASLDETNKEIQDRLDVKHLNILRAIIVNEEMKRPKEIAEHEEEYKRIEALVTKIQDDINFLSASGPIDPKKASTSTAVRAPLVILPFMGVSDDEQSERAALRLMVFLLMGGNKSIQTTLYDFFQSARNITFFQDIANHMKDSSVAIKEMRALMSARAKEEANRKELISNTMRKSTMRGTIRRNSGETASLTGSLMTGSLTGIMTGTIRKDEKAKPGLEMSELSKLHLQESMTEMLKDSADTDDDEEDVIEFNTIVGFIEELLTILQLLCEDHNQKMKSYISKQTNNIKSVNLVEKAVEYLHVLYLNIDEDSISLAIQNFEMLIEVTMGHQGNQIIVFDAKVVDIINFILRQSTFKGCDDEVGKAKTIQLKKAAILLASTMLEDNNSLAPRLAHDLYAVLDIDAVKATMYDPRFSPTAEGPEDPAEVGFLCYRVLLRLRDFNPENDSNIDQTLGLVIPKSKNPTEAEKYRTLELYNKGIESIEIVKEEIIQKVYFRVGTMRENLRDELKDELLWSVERGSPVDKIRDFLDRSEEFIEKMKYQEMLYHNFFLRLLIQDLSPYLYWFLLLLTFAINVVMLSVWRANYNLDAVYPITPGWYKTFLYTAGSFHIVTCLLVAAEHFIADPPRKLNPLQEGTDWLVLSHWYFLAVIAFSFAGIWTDGYTYSFHLFHVIVNNNLLGRVLQSVTKNGRALLAVAMLGLIITYQFSLISFAYYRASYTPSLNPMMLCDTFWQCFLTTLDTGLRAGGGIGDALAPTSTEWSYIGPRTIFDLAYFIIISTIGLNIIFGIIVDTFSELRDEKFQIEEDMRSKCFICSLPADEFDRSGRGFENHIKGDHNMWSYLFFLAFLSEKEHEDYTSNEIHVFRNADEPDWFPINRAIALQQTTDEISDQLREIRKQVQGLVDRFEQEDLRRLQRQQQRRQNEIMQDNQDEE